MLNTKIDNITNNNFINNNLDLNFKSTKTDINVIKDWYKYGGSSPQLENTHNNEENNIENIISSSNNLNILENLVIGDYIKLIFNDKNNEVTGYVTYYSNNKIEVLNHDGITVILNIKNNKVENLNQAYILKKTDYPGYINFMNLKQNSKVRLISKSEKYNDKIGIIHMIDGNEIKIKLENTPIEELISLDLLHGLSDDNFINRIEVIDNILDDHDEIIFLDDSNLIITEQDDILEQDYIVSKLEANEILTNELMKILYRNNIYKKQHEVREIINNLSFIINHYNNDSELSEQEKYRKKNNIFKRIVTSNFKNTNIVPIVEMKKVIYTTNNDTEEKEYTVEKSDTKTRNVLANLYNKFQKDQTVGINTNYDNYIKEIIQLELPYIIDTKNGTGFVTNLKEDVNLYNKQSRNYNKLHINRFLGEIFRPSEKNIDNDDINILKSTYYPNYWISNNHSEMIKIHDGDRINIIGFYIFSNYILNFDSSTNRVILSNLDNKYSDKTLENIIKQLKKKIISVNLSETKTVDYKLYQDKIIQLYFGTNYDLTKEEYYNLLDKIIPPPIELLNKNKKKKITSMQQFNDLVIPWDINLTDITFNEAYPIYKLINNNVNKIKMINTNKLVNEYFVKYTQFNNEVKIDFLDNKLLNNDDMINIYGKYPYFGKEVDSLLTRYEWITDHSDNGSYFFMKYINNITGDLSGTILLNLKNKIINEITLFKNQIEQLQKEIDNIVSIDSKCMSLFISIIYNKYSDLINDPRQDIKLGDYCLLVENNNYRVYKRIKINNVPNWVLESNIVDKVQNISFSTNINDNIDKYKDQMEKIIKKNSCNKPLNDNNNCLYENVSINGISEQACINKNISSINYQISELKVSLDFFENKLDNLNYINKIVTKIQIENKNLILQNQKMKKETNNFVDIPESRVSVSKLKKNFDKIVSEKLIDYRNDLIYDFINTKLREANPGENPDYYYNPDTDEQIAAKDWLLEVLITKDPANSTIHSKKLILEYGQRADGYYISNIDGRMLFPLESDDFSGYDNEEGVTNIHREIIIDEEELKLESIIDRDLKVIEKQVFRYKIDVVLNILIFLFLESINNNNPLKKSDRLFIYQNVLNILESYEKGPSFYKNLKTLFNQKYKKEYNNNNRDDKEQINNLKTEKLLELCVKKTVSIFIIIIQTGIPNYPINRVGKINCPYSVEGRPYDTIEYEDNSMVKYIVCILKYISKENTSSNGILQFIKQRSEETIFDSILREYNNWYQNYSEIKIKYEKHDERDKRQNTNYIDNKVWVGFKPDSHNYDNSTYIVDKLLKNIDNIINLDKSKVSEINKFSKNCCLTNISNLYINFFTTFHKNNKFGEIYNKILVDYPLFDEQRVFNVVKLDSIPDFQKSLQSNYFKIDIYPNHYNQEIKNKLFIKFTINGNKRHINHFKGKCMITGDKSELFLFEYYQDINIQDYKKYSLYKSNLERSIVQKENLLIKERRNLTDEECRILINNVNSKNLIKLDYNNIQYKDNLSTRLNEICNNISFYSDATIFIEFTKDIEDLYNIWDNLNIYQKKDKKEQIFSILSNKINNSIKKIQDDIVTKIITRCDIHSIKVEDLIDLDKNAKIIYRDYRKVVYKEYLEKIIINLSKFINNNYKKIVIPPDWKANQETTESINTLSLYNYEIYQLYNQIPKYEDNTIELIRTLLQNFSKIYNLLNMLSFDNDELSINSDKTIKVSKFNNNDYFDIYKFLFYSCLDYLFRYTNISQYNDFSCQFFILNFNQIKNIKNKFNVTIQEIKDEVIEVLEADRQFHIGRVNIMKDEERKIDNELKKHKLAFYGQHGKEDWQRGVVSNNTSEENDNNENVLIVPTKIDKRTEYSDIQQYDYDDDNNENKYYWD